jgi:hypothetical protein
MWKTQMCWELDKKPTSTINTTNINQNETQLRHCRKRSLSRFGGDRIIFNKAEKQVFLLFLIFEQIKNDTREVGRKNFDAAFAF